MAGLTRSTFTVRDDGPGPEPGEIIAHEDGIAIVAWQGETRHEVFLSPRHIEAIVAMHEDWWGSHWAALHEEQA